jgi:hypothetical protein
MPPRISIVQQMASLLVAQRYKPAPPPAISKSWVRKFVERYDMLKSKYNWKYDYQQAKCEDPELIQGLIQGLFQRVQCTQIEYGIADNDTYNFDETGFQMVVISMAMVITGTDRAGRPRTTQPGCDGLRAQ